MADFVERSMLIAGPQACPDADTHTRESPTRPPGRKGRGDIPCHLPGYSGFWREMLNFQPEIFYLSSSLSG